MISLLVSDFQKISECTLHSEAPPCVTSILKDERITVPLFFQILNQTEAPKSEICLIYKIGQESPKSSHSASQGRKLLGVAVVSRRDSIGKAVRGLMTRATAALTMVAGSKCCQKVIRLFSLSVVGEV